MKLKNPFKEFTKFELILWLSSCALITAIFALGGQKDTLTLVASLIGVTALIFVAKGDVIGQAITILFAIFYSIISFKFQYYGEMITYLGMTAPISLFSTISWIKNPYENGKNEVRIASLTKFKFMILSLLTIAVTIIFYFILKYFETSSLIVSTISIATSFMASSLCFLRSPYYAVAYACNDIVLIILWIIATVQNIMYLPMILCFVIFLVNDIYAFTNWERMRIRQADLIQENAQA